MFPPCRPGATAAFAVHAAACLPRRLGRHPYFSEHAAAANCNKQSCQLIFSFRKWGRDIDQVPRMCRALSQEFAPHKVDFFFLFIFFFFLAILLLDPASTCNPKLRLYMCVKLRHKGSVGGRDMRRLLQLQELKGRGGRFSTTDSSSSSDILVSHSAGWASPWLSGDTDRNVPRESCSGSGSRRRWQEQH